MRFILIVILSLSLISCKAKAVVRDSIQSKPTTTQDKQAIGRYTNNQIEFSTLNIKSNVGYTDPKQNYNLSAEIKIKKDQQILISLRFFGITMAKASITPTSVSYYEKMGSSYFEGDFSTLSQWLGTDLDYSKVQNLLLGRAMDNLNQGNFKETQLDNQFVLEDQTAGDFKKTFYVDATNFMLNKQEVIQVSKNRKIEIAYSKNEVFKEGSLPLIAIINAIQAKGNTKIELEYTAVSFNEELSFPYAVPSGYKKITIN